MRALAETLMKGRNQAIMVVMIAAMLPLLYWVSAAGVALITLRKGVSEGVKLLFWGILPSIFWMLSGDPSAIMVISGTFALAVLLRQTVSWQKVLIALIPAGVLCSFLLDVGLAPLLDQIASSVQQLASERGAAFQDWPEQRVRSLLVGVVSAFQVASMLVCLMLARSWQAKLYNPGGFQAEFHQLRLPVVLAVMLALVLLLSKIFAVDISRWFALLLLPLIVAGLALIHGLVSKRGLNKGWLVATYASIVFVGPYMVTLLVILACVDALMDLRSRLPAKN